MKDRKQTEQNFHSVAGVMPRGGTWGAGWVKNFSVGICDCAPSTVHSSFVFFEWPLYTGFPVHPKMDFCIFNPKTWSKIQLFQNTAKILPIIMHILYLHKKSFQFYLCLA